MLGSPTVIFIKTVKTAGTSTELFLEKTLLKVSSGVDKQGWTFAKNGFSTPRPATDESPGLPFLWSLKHPKLWQASLALHRLSNHAGPQKVREVVGEKMWNSALKVVNVRHPLDLVVSEYFFRYRNHSDPPRFEDYCENLSVPPVNDEVGEFYSDSWVRIRYENLEHDLWQFAEQQGLPGAEPVPRLKTGIRPSSARNYETFFTPKLRRIVQEKYRNWFEKFSYI
jgi:hypothetical protein